MEDMPKIKSVLVCITLAVFIICICEGCSNESDITDPGIDISFANEKVDLYLFPGVGTNHPWLIVNDTVYDIFYNGKYLGEFEASRADPLTIYLNNSEINESVLNSTNKSLTFWPGEELTMLARSRDGTIDGIKIYNNQIDYVVPDKAVDIIIPEFWDVKKDTLRFIISEFDTRDSYHNPENISVDARIVDTYTFDISIMHNPSFNQFSCDYDSHQIDRVYTDLSINDWSYRYGESLYNLEDDFYIRIETGVDFNQTTITCSFIDEDYYIDYQGNIVYDSYDDERKDIGLPNPSFEIILT